MQSATDDAEERNSDGDVLTNDNDLELTDDAGNRGPQTIGLRFQNIDIPQGASITNAYLEFTTAATDSGATDIIIEGEATDDAPVFITSTNNITGRNPTTNSVIWNSVPAWNTIDGTHQTPNLATIVQEIIDRDGWADGNAMSFIITGSGERTAYSYDGTSTKAPLLHIELNLTTDTTSWPMTDSNNYIYDTEKIEFSNGYAQVKTHAGDFLNNIIDSYNFNTTKTKTPDIIHISGNIYASAYTGSDYDGYIKTFEIAPDGIITKSIIDTLEFETIKAKYIRIIHISGNIYALTYKDYHSSDVKTVEILPDGQISDTIIDTFIFDNTEAKSTPHILHVTGDIYAIFYSGYGDTGDDDDDDDHGEDGQVVTIEITTNGQITNNVIDHYEFEPIWGKNPYPVEVASNIFAIAYEGKDNKGKIATVEIANNGQITKSKIDSFTFSYRASDIHMIPVANDIFAIVYRHRYCNARGALETVEILPNGQITNTIDTFFFEKDRLEDPEIIHIFENAYVIAYQGLGENGFTVAVEINDNGTIPKSITDQLIFSSNRGSKHLNLLKLNNSVIVVAYEESPSDSGYIKTIGISIGYRADSPSLRPITTFSTKYFSVNEFNTTENTDGGSIRYQITNDGYNPNPTWYYWTGTNWNTATLSSHYNDSTTVNNNISQFKDDIGRGDFSFQAFLISDGSQFVRLENVNLDYGYVLSSALDATIISLDRLYEHQENKVRIDYTLSDSASAAGNFTTDTTQVQYSTSLFGPWSDAAITGFTDNLTSSPTGITHNETFEPLVWDATGVPDGIYYLRIKPHNGTKYAPKYSTTSFTVNIHTPGAEEILRHGQIFLDGAKQNFYFNGFNGE